MTKNEYTKEFLDFWGQYPKRLCWRTDRHVKIGKSKACEQLSKLNTETQQFIMQILPVFVKSISSTIIPDPWRWLRDKKYDDYELEVERVSKPRPVEPEIVPVSAERRAELARKVSTSLKRVPKPDKRSISDKANAARKLLRADK